MTDRSLYWLRALLLVAAGVGPAAAQQFPQWGRLEAGPHAVGFRVIQTHDRTRGYWPLVRYDGRRDTLETARPMQISIWYPATVAPDAARLVFGEYVTIEGGALGPDRTTPAQLAATAEELRRGPLSPYFRDGVSDEQFREILATPTAVIRDAAPAAGSFPIVIHAGFTIGQTVLLEYLASHGYVVASFPLLGTTPAWYHRGEGTPESYQSGADDIGFVLATLDTLPFADGDRAAVIGMMSANGLLFEMQQQRLSALAALDGSYPDALRQVPGFDLHAVRIPLLDMPRTDPRDRAMLDSLRYADRFLVRFDSVRHADFYQFQRIAHPARADEHASYRFIARYTRAFLDRALRSSAAVRTLVEVAPEQMGVPNGFASVSHQPPLPPAPTAGEFLLLIREGVHAEARRVWDAYRASDPPRPLVEEGPFTTTLFFLRRDAGPAGSLEAFRLLADMFPRSWRAREQLALTLRQAGDSAASRETYREALRLLREAPVRSDRDSDESRLEAAIAQLER